MNYENSGVNINKANKMINGIKELIGSNIGLYAGIYPLYKHIGDYKKPCLISSSDGIGTKLLLLEKNKRWDIAAQDLVAMNANDLVCMGAKPLYFMDYYSTSKLNETEAMNFIKELNKILKSINCELLGGETAELPGMYKNETVDISGFITGIVEEDEILKKENVKENDIILALNSNGPHSNGFSLIRSLIDSKKLDIDEDLINPTRLYVNETLECKKYLKAAAHITGGGIVENLERIIPENLTANLKLNWEIPNIFKKIKNSGVELEEMFKVFNMGIGMIYILEEKNISKVQEILEKYKISNFIIGKMEKYMDKKVFLEI
ncbi:phosphoribosylformylglycinamidine cyclo-ligase [Oceanotoga teriensis]|uniref:phosphoribosylformylglycinamidine cyclo-ligase n=1 Tax=Oceanotoga teriensis TaxID=515440 RepID=UPI002713E02B|nr:phosphoribosylformylglycinamidine cyclo-ligase [Oceanotoga teriensis]MDO7975445.1 phosphoribosylformylglycinamidine cyclo-ligase [Oceanotoga teriensis]